jgi:single-stranded-DNA-specific exonuclease
MDTSGFTAYDLAFKLAPRINASGRMGHAEIGIHALTTQSPSTARYLAGQLNSMNTQRQSLERQIIDYIEEQIISQRDLKNLRTLVFSGNGWHRGVLGIVAARLAGKYHRPTLVLDIENGMARGSGRSVDGFNLYKALARLGHLFEKFGGHDHAAGFTLRATNLDTLTTELEGIARRELPEEGLIPGIEIDAEVSLTDLTLETARQTNALSPFGSGNPEPLLYAHSLEVIGSSVVGDNHLKLRIRQGDCVREAIGFGLGDKRPCKGTSVQMVFTPEINLWRGSEKIQLRVIDLEVMDP